MKEECNVMQMRLETMEKEGDQLRQVLAKADARAKKMSIEENENESCHLLLLAEEDVRMYRKLLVQERDERMREKREMGTRLQEEQGKKRQEENMREDEEKREKDETLIHCKTLPHILSGVLQRWKEKLEEIVHTVLALQAECVQQELATCEMVRHETRSGTADAETQQMTSWSVLQGELAEARKQVKEKTEVEAIRGQELILKMQMAEQVTSLEQQLHVSQMDVRAMTEHLRVLDADRLGNVTHQALKKLLEERVWIHAQLQALSHDIATSISITFSLSPRLTLFSPSPCPLQSIVESPMRSLPPSCSQPEKTSPSASSSSHVMSHTCMVHMHQLSALAPATQVKGAIVGTFHVYVTLSFLRVACVQTICMHVYTHTYILISHNRIITHKYKVYTRIHTRTQKHYD